MKSSTSKKTTSQQQPKQLAIPEYKKFKLKKQGDELRITLRWFRMRSRWRLIVPALLLLCAGGMIFGYALDSVAGISLMLLMSMGVSLTLYDTLLDLLNKTTIIVSRTTLKITHGPLPVPFQQRRKRFDATDISQLYVAEDKSYNGRVLSGLYQLYAIVNNKHEALLPGEAAIAQWERVLYLEQEIERHLALQDYPVPEEPNSPDALGDAGQAVWQAVAGANHLTFTPRSALKGGCISGHYRGFYLEFADKLVDLAKNV